MKKQVTIANALVLVCVVSLLVLVCLNITGFIILDKCESKFDECVATCKKSRLELLTKICITYCGAGYAMCKENGRWPIEISPEWFTHQESLPEKKTYTFTTTIMKKGEGRCAWNIQPVVTIGWQRQIGNLCFPISFALTEGEHTIRIEAEGCDPIEDKFYINSDLRRDYFISCD